MRQINIYELFQDIPLEDPDMEPTLKVLYATLPDRKNELPRFEDDERVFRKYVAVIRDLVSECMITEKKKLYSNTIQFCRRTNIASRPSRDACRSSM